MTEYVLVRETKDGPKVLDIIVSARPLAEMRKIYRSLGVEVHTIDRVPKRILEQYQYWEEWDDQNNVEP